MHFKIAISIFVIFQCNKRNVPLRNRYLKNLYEQRIVLNKITIWRDHNGSSLYLKISYFSRNEEKLKQCKLCTCIQEHRCQSQRSERQREKARESKWRTCMCQAGTQKRQSQCSGHPACTCPGDGNVHLKTFQQWQSKNNLMVCFGQYFFFCILGNHKTRRMWNSAI